MKVTNITVGRTISDGDFGSKKLEISGELGPKENEFEVAFEMMKDIVKFLESGAIPEVVKEIAPSKKSAKTEEPTKVGRMSKEEKVEAKTEAKPKAKAAKKVAKKTTKKVKNTSVPYNRDLSVHKAEFANIMTSVDQNWKAQGKKAAVKTSKDMEGTDMFVSNTDDTVLESFKEQAEALYLKNFKEMNNHA